MMDDDLTFTNCSQCGRPHGGSKLYCSRCNYDMGKQMSAGARERLGINKEREERRIGERLQKAIDEIKAENERNRTGVK
jgi:hypothetical protein